MRKLLLVLSLVGAMLMPATSSAAVTPKFQVRCDSSHLAQEDPIVAPGTQSAHQHEFFGNTSTNKDSTVGTMRAASTLCTASGDTAGYWTPTVLRDDGSVVRATNMLVYYRGNPNGSHVEPFPADLRMVSRQFRIRTDKPSVIIVSFPPCWDGVNLDSPDHISHMSFRRGSGCPASHPVQVPKVTEVFRYPVNISGFQLSSGPFSTGHADFWNTWNQFEFEGLVNRCLNGGLDCGRIDN